MTEPLQRPHLTFACELDARALPALFADSGVSSALVELGAQVSLGLLDLSAERAAVVRRLNAAGIPVVAWLLLPEDEGYWFNLDNAPQARARYAAFRAWTRAEALTWAGVALDIEPDMREMEALMSGSTQVLPAILRRTFDVQRFRQARASYHSLVAQIRADGYPVHVYQFPFIVDERRVGSTVLQRVAGLIDLDADREGLMLYSSFTRPRGAALLWSYGPEAQSIGVGSTGGGVTVGGIDEIPPLTWEELGRDLRLARVWTDEIFVFSLEGCVREGYLERLRDFDWHAPVVAPVREARRIDGLRRLFRGVLWFGAHPEWLLILTGLVVGGGWLWRHWRREEGR